MKTTRSAISRVAAARNCVPNCRGNTAAAKSEVATIQVSPSRCLLSTQPSTTKYVHCNSLTSHNPTRQTTSHHNSFSTTAFTDADAASSSSSAPSTASSSTACDEQPPPPAAPPRMGAVAALEEEEEEEEPRPKAAGAPAVEEYCRVLQQLCRARQGGQAEEYYRRVILPHQSALFLSELQTCQNLVLWCWAKSNDGNAPDRAQQFLTHHVPHPTSMSYRHLLTCWSRAKKHPAAGQRAESILKQMRDSPHLKDHDQWQAYHLVLKACQQARDGDRAVRLLEEMIQQQQQQQQSDTGEMTEFKMNKHILTTVLMALKSKPIRAESLMFHLQHNFGLRPDTFHYATVMDAWAQARNGPRCEALLERMQEEGVKPSTAVHNSVLHSWRGNLDRMESLFCQMVNDYLMCSFRNPSSLQYDQQQQQHQQSMNNNYNHKKQQKVLPAVQPNVESLSIVLDAQAQAKAPDRAEKLLAWIMNNPTHRSVIEPNVVCFSSVLNAWARVNEPAKAERLLRQMQQAGYEPNAVTFTTVLHGWALQGNVERCQALWNEMIHHHNIQPNQNTLNSFLLAHANAGKPQEAEQILEHVREQFGLDPDLVSFTTVLRAYQQAGQPQRARKLLDEMREKEKREGIEFLDVVAYNTVIQAYSKAGMTREAEEVLHQMMETTNRKTQPNIQSFSQVMAAYNRSKDSTVRKVAAAKAEELWSKIDAMGLKPNLIAFNVLLQCFSRSGEAERVESVIKAMENSGSVEPDIISYNTCLQAWARGRNAERAEKLLFEMVSNVENRQGKKTDRVIRPDVFSFSIVLSAWAKQATPYAAERAQTILKHMHEMGESCKPDTISYNTVIQAWLKLAKRAKETCSNEEFLKLAEKCAERADALLLEMEELQKTPDGGRVRPDSLSYESVIMLCEMARKRQRTQVLTERLNNVKQTRK